MTQRIAGVCYIKVDGEQLSIEGGVEIPLGESNRETRMSSTGVAGYSETLVAPFVNCSATLTPDFPVEKLQNGTDMTITAELANGWVYTLQGAFLVGGITMNGTDGNVTLNFNGTKGSLQV